MAGSLIMPKYKLGTDYVKTKWGPDVDGDMHDNYNCVRCQFATLDPEAFNAHMKGEHRNNAPGRHPWPAKERGAEWEDEEGTPHKISGYHPLATANPFAKTVTEVKK